MRIANLRVIAELLKSTIKAKGYFIYIAPLNPEHYNRYVELLNSHLAGAKDIEQVLTDNNIIKSFIDKIDIKTEILVDTNLYVSMLNSKSLTPKYELFNFLIINNIDCRFIIGNDELITELENKPIEIDNY